VKWAVIYNNNSAVNAANLARSSPKDPLSFRERAMSLCELVVGSFFVIGHNLFHVAPNEVPFLFAFYWISGWIRGRPWRMAGFEQPQSWPKTWLFAAVAALVRQAGGAFVIEPLASRIWHAPEQVSSVLKSSALGWRHALVSLLIVWSFAAFGEETGYRGYLLTRAADVGGHSRLAYAAAVVYVALLFGLGHFYKGPVGIADSTFSGLVLGGLYLFTGRNLWACILAHGLSDTFAVVVISLGWAT
jgi:membrane protease YdiL (CAAX protease family)